MNFETRLTAEPENTGGAHTNAVGRTYNSLIRTMNNNRVIPKWIVVVPETDFMNSIQYTEYGVSGAYGMLVEYAMKQFNLAIQSLIANLPHKANKYNWPVVLWIEPTLHCSYLHQENQLRIKFIRSLHIAAINQSRMVVLPLKQNWDVRDTSYLLPNKRMSQFGLEKFCAALDCTIKYADTKVMRNHGQLIPQIFVQEKLQQEMETRITSFEQTQNGFHHNNRRINQQHRFRHQFRQVHRHGFPPRPVAPRPSAPAVNQPRPSNSNNQLPVARQRVPSSSTSSCHRELFKDTRREE